MTDQNKIDIERGLFEAWIHTKAEQEDDQPQPEPHKIHTFSEDELNEYTLSTMFEAWQARASIKPAIPTGWQLVPIEPTAEMLGDGKEAQRFRSPSYRSALLAYRAMLKAAPTPPQGEPS